jgi:superfamily I DNA and/or RNA helicase
VAWLDTGDVASCRDEERQWKSPGEVDVVAALLTCAGEELDPTRVTEERIAILSPYHDQLSLLHWELSKEYSSKGLLHTTDSFQGREADIIVVSLVRTNDLESSDMTRIGHLAKKHRINVLLSRARKLLVLVGDFEHFKSTEDTKWPLVCELFEELDGRIPSSAQGALQQALVS